MSLGHPRCPDVYDPPKLPREVLPCPDEPAEGAPADRDQREARSSAAAKRRE